jgi:hypothetical protein
LAIASTRPVIITITITSCGSSAVFIVGRGPRGEEGGEVQPICQRCWRGKAWTNIVRRNESQARCFTGPACQGYLIITSSFDNEVAGSRLVRRAAAETIISTLVSCGGCAKLQSISERQNRASKFVNCITFTFSSIFTFNLIFKFRINLTFIFKFNLVFNTTFVIIFTITCVFIFDFTFNCVFNGIFNCSFTTFTISISEIVPTSGDCFVSTPTATVFS